MREALLDREAERERWARENDMSTAHRTALLPSPSTTTTITISITPALQDTALAFIDSAPFIWFVVTPASILVRACVSFFLSLRMCTLLSLPRWGVANAQPFSVAPLLAHPPLSPKCTCVLHTLARSTYLYLRRPHLLRSRNAHHTSTKKVEIEEGCLYARPGSIRTRRAARGLYVCAEVPQRIQSVLRPPPTHTRGRLACTRLGHGSPPVHPCAKSHLLSCAPRPSAVASSPPPPAPLPLPLPPSLCLSESCPHTAGTRLSYANRAADECTCGAPLRPPPPGAAYRDSTAHVSVALRGIDSIGGHSSPQPQQQWRRLGGGV